MVRTTGFRGRSRPSHRRGRCAQAAAGSLLDDAVFDPVKLTEKLHARNRTLEPRIERRHCARDVRCDSGAAQATRDTLGSLRRRCLSIKGLQSSTVVGDCAIGKATSSPADKTAPRLDAGRSDYSLTPTKSRAAVAGF